MGAWIEIDKETDTTDQKKRSHPLWVRGLKYAKILPRMWSKMSHPLWVRGLKL